MVKRLVSLQPLERPATRSMTLTPLGSASPRASCAARTDGAARDLPRRPVTVLARDEDCLRVRVDGCDVDVPTEFARRVYVVAA